jgi:hypothetical protein
MKIRITDIGSQAVRVVKWEGEADRYGMGTLTIEFHSGKEYDYFDVPFGDIEKMVGTDSFGFYLNNSIKPFYECREVTPIF